MDREEPARRESPENDQRDQPATVPSSSTRLPPRWFIHLAWRVHRMLFRVSGRRFGLRRPTPGRYGMLALTTRGRRTGQERVAIVGYVDDGGACVTMAMNGWDQPPPAWWVNLQAHPEASIQLAGDRRPHAVRAREAEGEERARLWNSLRAAEDEGSDLDALARLRNRPTPVVVLEPIAASASTESPVRG